MEEIKLYSTIYRLDKSMCLEWLQELFWGCGLCGEVGLASNEELIASYEQEYGLVADGTSGWHSITTINTIRGLSPIRPGETSRAILNL